MKKRMAVILSLVMILSCFSFASIPTTSYAATKLSKKTANIKVGKSKTLKLKGASGKVTWKSSKKSVATVSSKGVVKAKKAGIATITATNRGKSYK